MSTNRRFITLTKPAVIDIWVKERLRGLFLSGPRFRRADFPSTYKFLLFDQATPTTYWQLEFDSEVISFTDVTTPTDIGGLIFGAALANTFYIQGGEAKWTDASVTRAIKAPQLILPHLELVAGVIQYDPFTRPTLE